MMTPYMAQHKQQNNQPELSPNSLQLAQDLFDNLINSPINAAHYFPGTGGFAPDDPLPSSIFNLDSFLVPARQQNKLKTMRIFDSFECEDFSSDDEDSCYLENHKTTKRRKLKDSPIITCEENSQETYVPEFSPGHLIEHLLKANEELIAVCLELQNRNRSDRPEFIL